MKRIRYPSLAFAVVLALGLAATVASADQLTCPGNTPTPNAAILDLRVFNDCPSSTLTPINSYPAMISIEDVFNCVGGANRHLWDFATGAVRDSFENCSHYGFNATFQLNGIGEGGLRLCPWWSLPDGQFMANSSTGEVACFGGRLPFYSFTVNNGVHYVAGTPIFMQIIYSPHNVNVSNPATINYTITYGGNTYSSGELPFDSGNLTEAAAHGSYGELWWAIAGGYMQVTVNPSGSPTNDLTAIWSDINFIPPVVPAKSTTWGHLKSLYR